MATRLLAKESRESATKGDNNGQIVSITSRSSKFRARVTSGLVHKYRFKYAGGDKRGFLAVFVSFAHSGIIGSFGTLLSVRHIIDSLAGDRTWPGLY